jgi:hypothetical protein
VWCSILFLSRGVEQDLMCNIWNCLTPFSACSVLYADDLQKAAATAAELKANNSPLQLQSIQEANSAAEAARARDAGMVGTSVSLAAKDDILEQSVFTSADMQYVPLPLNGLFAFC